MANRNMDGRGCPKADGAWKQAATSKQAMIKIANA